jgi:hypothetical protein
MATLAPSPVVAPPVPSPSIARPPASAACARTAVDLPSALAPCTAPGALELRDASLDLAVQVSPSSVRLKRGGAIDFTFTMTNRSKAPLHLVLREPQEPIVSVSQVLESGDRPIEIPPAPPPMVNPACAKVDCARPVPSASASHSAEVTLAPGGVATAHGSWRARRQTWPKTEPLPCCQLDLRRPIDAGPLPAGSYRVAFVPPVSDDNGQLALQHDEIVVDIAP